MINFTLIYIFQQIIFCTACTDANSCIDPNAVCRELLGEFQCVCVDTYSKGDGGICRKSFFQLGDDRELYINQFNSEPVQFIDAQSECANLDGILPIPASSEENDFLKELFVNRMWLGLSKGSLTIAPYLYTNWALNEPSGKGDAIYMDSEGEWHDADPLGTEEISFICYLTQRYIKIYSQRAAKDFGQFSCTVDHCVASDGEDFFDFTLLTGLDNYRFKIDWDEGNTTLEWEQLYHPLSKIHSYMYPSNVKLNGYSFSHRKSEFDGLSVSNQQSNTLLDGTDSKGWFYSIGYKAAWTTGGNGQPTYWDSAVSADKQQSGAKLTELYLLEIDECISPTQRHTCDLSREECKNTVGSFHCTCKPGFILSSYGLCQIDNKPGNYWYLMNHKRTGGEIKSVGVLSIHECIEICTVDSICVAVTFEESTKKCTFYRIEQDNPVVVSPLNGTVYATRNDQPVPVNMQSIYFDVYSSNQICSTENDTIVCVCNEGYSKDLNGLCKDVDECQTNIIALRANCPVAANNFTICENTLGSFNCNCQQGFEKDATNDCIDIDECRTPNYNYKHNCDEKYSRCANLAGSFECICTVGFIIDPVKKTCGDINECDTAAHNCGSNATCNNIIGSWKCDCDNGYAVDKSSGENYDCKGWLI